MATIVVVLGTLAASWRPMHSSLETTPTPAAGTSAAPDMSVYFPDRFPAPQGPVEALPPTF
jgi:hypothetical protein